MSLTSAGLSLPSNVCLVKSISTPARLGSQQMWHLTLIPGDRPPPAARGSLRCRIGSGGAGRAAAGGAVVLAEDDILGKGYGIISGFFFFVIATQKNIPLVSEDAASLRFLECGCVGVSHCKLSNSYCKEGTKKILNFLMLLQQSYFQLENRPISTLSNASSCDVKSSEGKRHLSRYLLTAKFN